jgi:hypothetical protein
MPEIGATAPVSSLKLTKTPVFPCICCNISKNRGQSPIFGNILNGNKNSRHSGRLCYEMCSATGFGGLGGADWSHAVKRHCAAIRAASILHMMPPAFMINGDNITAL